MNKIVPVRGWFTDPSGRHVARYWNGQDWSAFVLDGDTPHVDDMQIDRRLRSFGRLWADLGPGDLRLQVTAESVRWQGDVVLFSNVSGVTCRVDGLGSAATFRTLVEHRHGTLEIELPIGGMQTAELRNCERAVAGMLGSFEANLFPIAAFETARRVFRGEPFAVGTVCVTSVGITKVSRFRSRTLTWNQFLNLRANERELLVMIGKPDGGSAEFAAVPVSASNALMLGRVIESLLILQMPHDHRTAYLARPLPPGAQASWAVLAQKNAEPEGEFLLREPETALDRKHRSSEPRGTTVAAPPSMPIGSALLANFSSVLASVVERDRVLADARVNDGP